MNIAIRALTDLLPTTQMVFLRNVLSLFAICVWIGLRTDGSTIWRTRRINGHFWRAAIGFAAMELWFYSLSVMPLTTATALSFTAPIFATVFAIYILKEQAGWRRWLAIVIGFVGVMIILRPDSESISLVSLIVLCSSALMALSGTVVKTLTRTEQPETIVFFMALFMTPLSLPFAVPVWEKVSVEAWGLLAIVAFFSTASHLMLTRAYRHAQMVVLLPFDFTRLVFTAALAYIFFSEVMDAQTITGTLVIMASSLYIVHRETVLRRELKQHKPTMKEVL